MHRWCVAPQLFGKQTMTALAKLEADAHLLNNTIHDIETVADQHSLHGVRSRPSGEYVFALQSAIDDLPDLKAGLRDMTLKVIAQKIAHDPNEADRQMALARCIHQTIKEIRADLDARKATADPEKWEAVSNDLNLFQDFARSMFADVLKIIDAARTNKGF